MAQDHQYNMQMFGTSAFDSDFANIVRRAGEAAANRSTTHQASVRPSLPPCPICGGSVYRSSANEASCSECRSGFSQSATRKLTLDVLCGGCGSGLSGLSKNGKADPFLEAKSAHGYSARLHCENCGMNNDVRIDSRNGVQVKRVRNYVPIAATGLGLLAALAVYITTPKSGNSGS